MPSRRTAAARQARYRERQRSLGRTAWLVHVTPAEREELERRLEELRAREAAGGRVERPQPSRSAALGHEVPRIDSERLEARLAERERSRSGYRLRKARAPGGVPGWNIVVGGEVVGQAWMRLRGDRDGQEWVACSNKGLAPYWYKARTRAVAIEKMLICEGAADQR